MTEAVNEGKAPRRVVVAEDETLIRLDLVEMLGEEGYDVVGQTGDGASAVRLATEHGATLVLYRASGPADDRLVTVQVRVGRATATAAATSPAWPSGSTTSPISA